jgi:hypothetical protein
MGSHQGSDRCSRRRRGLHLDKVVQRRFVGFSPSCVRIYALIASTDIRPCRGMERGTTDLLEYATGWTRRTQPTAVLDRARQIGLWYLHSLPLAIGLLLTTSLLAVLPQASNGGYLPYWLAFVAVVSVYNTIQAFVTPTLTKRIYSRKPEEGK